MIIKLHDVHSLLPPPTEIKVNILCLQCAEEGHVGGENIELLAVQYVLYEAGAGRLLEITELSWKIVDVFQHRAKHGHNIDLWSSERL